MAYHIDMALLFDSSSDEDDLINIPPALPPTQQEDDAYQNVLPVLDPVLGIMQRIEHIKVNNYIENVVIYYTNVDFIMHFRLSRQVAYGLIDQFRMSYIYTSMENLTGRLKITAEKHLLCFLWFVGHQTASYRDVADRFEITISTLYHVTSRVTEFLISIAPNIIKYPTADEKRETSTFYEERKGFSPGIIGAIDGSHVRIDKPLEDPDSYINRKRYFSLHIQGTVDQNIKFIDVFVGYPGSVHDARVFKNSPLYDHLHELCEDNYFLLGDSAYPCLKNLIVPYRDNGHLTHAQRSFNRQLSSCRVIIENAFGCLKQRFRQLYHCKLRDIVRMVQVIYACCVLHNLANNRELEYFEVNEPMNDEYPDIEAQNFCVEIYNAPRELENGIHIRDELCRLISG